MNSVNNEHQGHSPGELMNREILSEAVNELSTLRDLIRWGMSRFRQAKLHSGHGLPDAQDEATYLVLHALHLPHDLHGSYFDTRLTRREREAALALLLRRMEERRPAAYLTGEAWFAGMPFYVDDRVLVPRSPIAEVIESRFTPWMDPNAVGSILDLCTGSGCIAIACAFSFPDAEVDASDLSTEALEVARRNLERHGMSEELRLIRSDLFAGIDGGYDIIVANPPYVDAADMAALPAEFRHEPEEALAAGEDGLDLVRKILRDAPNHLNQNGILVVEVGNSAEALTEQFPEVPFIWIEFERGEGEVFLLTAEQLQEFQPLFAAAA